MPALNDLNNFYSKVIIYSYFGESVSKRKTSGNIKYRLSFIFGCVVPLFFKAKDKSICEGKKRKKITPVLLADHRAPTEFATVILLRTLIRRA